MIGQAPSANSDPHRPLEGRPALFLSKILGWPEQRFLDAFERANVLGAYPGKSGKGDVFNLTEAVPCAKRMEAEGLLVGRNVVYLGSGVAHAFGARAAFLEVMWRTHGGRSHMHVVVPHPSGINQWWNSDVNKRAAAHTLRIILEGE